MYELEKNTPLSMYISHYLLMQLLKKDLSQLGGGGGGLVNDP
jgi:hypothetical protein